MDKSVESSSNGKNKYLNNIVEAGTPAISKKDILSGVQLNMSFKHNMDSLKSLVDLVFPYVEKNAKQETESLIKFIENTMSDGKLEKENDGRNLRKILKNIKASTQKCEHPEIFYKSNFIVMLSYFEYLIKDVVKCFYLNYPESLKRKDKNLTYKELLDFESLDDAFAFIVDKECNNMTYSSFKEYMVEIIDKRLKVKNFECPNIESINEAFQRRNILVHNNGIVNDIYLKKVDNKFINYAKGEIVSIEKEYFKKVFQEVELLGNILQFLLLNKLPQKAKILEHNLILEYSYELLVDKNYNGLITYYHNIKRFKLSTEAKMNLIVNYLIAEKKVGKKNLDELIVETIPDWSMYSSIIKTAIYALKNDKENLKLEIINASFTSDEWEEYPLFDELREDSKFSSEVFQMLLVKETKEITELSADDLNAGNSSLGDTNINIDEEAS
jgi:hypothetical protein